MERRPNHRQNGRENLLAKVNSKQFLKYLLRQYYRFNHLPFTNKGEVFNMGYTHPFYQPEFVVWFKKNWVSWIDSILDEIPQGTNEYADIFGLRGLSFQEFRYVIISSMNDEGFKKHRIFDYLFITKEEEKKFFITSIIEDEEKLLEGFLQAVKNVVQLEIPILNSFFFTTKVPLYFPIKALKRHCYILGQSGSGKSELMKLLFYDLQRRSQKYWNKTLLAVEPHGDLSIELLSFALNNVTKKDRTRLVYLDPFIRETAQQIFGYDLLQDDYTFVLNPFEYHGNSSKEINYICQELSSAFFEILKNDATTQMDALIEACVETLIRKKGTDISDLKRFMDNDENEDLLEFGSRIPNIERRKMMKKIIEDSKLNPTKSGIYYRLQSLIGDSEFRRLLVGNSTVDLQKEMDSGKVIICNLAKAKMGKKAAPVYGKLLMALIQGYAAKRQDQPKNKRKETFCFVDEFQNYVTKSVETILAENRKYALHMILANQVIGQNMDTDMRRIILGNTALKIAGDNEQDSLKIMSENMGKLTPKDFEKLPKFSFYVYNKENKKNGVQTVRVPDFLVKQKPPFYLPNEELKEIFLWLVHKSGYYKKVKPVERLEKGKDGNDEISPNRPLGIPKVNSDFYNPKFDD